MASNPPETRKHAVFGTKARLAAIALLAVLALADLGAILRLRHASPPPAAPPPALAVPVAAAPTGPEFDVVRVDPQGNAVLAGRAAPGATITIKDNGNVIGTVTADAQGSFVLVPSVPLPAGAQQITMAETLPDGTNIAGQQTASINVPGNGGQVLTVLSGPNGSTVLSGQGPAAGQLGLGTVDYDANGHAIFSGTAPAGAHITLQLGGSPLGTAIADAKGHWRITAATPASAGTLSLSATSPSGSPLPGINVPFAPETLKVALAAGHVVIAPGDNLWLIARHVYGQGTLYTLIYTANASQIHDPNLIFPGQAFVLPKPKTAQ